MLSLILAIYLCFALHMTGNMAGSDVFRGLTINVSGTDTSGFVTAGDIDSELGNLSARIRNIRRDSINTLGIERKLMSLDKIESARCVILNNGEMRIDVVPLIPVARIFGSDSSYYINRTGKRMAANTHYHTDVPVIVGDFDSIHPPESLLPVVYRIDRDAALKALVSAIEYDRNHDIILVTMVRGLVINFGDTTDIDNKFARIEVMLDKVMKVKGWDYYDTLSVKWRGQVVATRRPKYRKAEVPEIVEEHEDIDDDGTMLTSTGQGQKTDNN